MKGEIEKFFLFIVVNNSESMVVGVVILEVISVKVLVIKDGVI